MISLNKKRRRIKRMIPSLLNPCTLLWGFLSFSALIFIFLPPTPIWQYIIGLPVACLSFYWYITMIWEEFLGEYERIVIRTNTTICPPNYWDSYAQDMFGFKGQTIIKTNFSAGFYLLDNIEIIEKMLLSQGMTSLLSFYEESKSSIWHATQDCIHTLSNIENSIGNFIELSTVKSANKISSEVVLGIQKDCRELIEILQHLSEKELPFQFVLLSQPSWNSQIQFDYREKGYCI